MTMKTRILKKNEKGQITLDFLFGCVLIIGVSAILGAITFALTLSEAIQYVSFSADRNYFAGDLTIQDQSDAASVKANTLLTKLPFLAGARNSGWITIKKATADNFSDRRKRIRELHWAPNPTRRPTDAINSAGFQIVFTLPDFKHQHSSSRERHASHLMEMLFTEQFLVF